MGVPTTLTPAAAEALDYAEKLSLGFETMEAERRHAAVSAVRAGAPVSVVASRIKVTRPTLYRWQGDLEAQEAEAASLTADDVL